MKQSPKKKIGGAVKFLLAGVVLLFLGIHSLNFFLFTFPSEQWYYSYLGFGLTSGAVVAYLIIFKTDADTDTKKTVSVVMLLVSVLGEIVTAGFGMQIEAMANAGFALTESDFSAMVLAVQILGLLHGVALMTYYAGDDIAELFGDDDGDGIPNIVDRDYKRPSKN